MSTDIQLAWPCPHLTMEEVVSLSDDRRSLLCKQPVASGGTVRIMINDEYFLPQGGLFTPAILRAGVSGPYDILEDENTVTITTSVGTKTVTLDPKRYYADALVQTLSGKGVDVASLSVENGHLVIADVFNVGPKSYAKVSGTAATALGFGSPGVSNHQWSARGTQLYPSWRLYTRPDEITNRFPKFDYPVRNANPIFKVTYTVPPQRCLRCGATYVENDYRFDASGQVLQIANEDLLYQAALKIVLTDKGSNPYYPWYGTSLRQRIGSKALPGVASLINEDVRKSLVKLQDLQKEQSKYQQVSFKERLFSIVSVKTQPHAQDPTTFLVDVTLQNASGEPINLNIVFTVPSVVALMGSNGLMLGNQIAGINPNSSTNLFLNGN